MSAPEPEATPGPPRRSRHRPLVERLEAEQRRTERLRQKVAGLQFELAEARWKLQRLEAGRYISVRRIVLAVRQRPQLVRRAPRDLLRALTARRATTPRPRRPDFLGAAAGGATPGSDATAAVGLTAPTIPDVAPPEGPVRRPGLTVAVILDPFSELAFRYEWRQVTFGQEDWRGVLDRERPELLFVESAWRGNEGRWNYTMTAPDAPRARLRELVDWCRDRGIPTVFWNKEDPPNYERFIETAKLFDRVFTVDSDCIERYRRDLGHDRVGVLQFAAQPRIHNPVRRHPGRPYDVAFAGTYFADKHDARRAQMDVILDPALEFELHIFSRMQAEDSRYQFPEKYASHVVGSLPYGRMLAANKMYKVFLNVNSVTDSPSMCARRVFELSACGTPLVSGWSHAIENLFGDRVPIAREAKGTRDLLSGLLSSPELRDRIALRAQRFVLAGHTFSDRVDSVLQLVGLASQITEPTVSIVVPTNRAHRIDAIIDSVAHQSYPRIQLCIVLHGIGAPIAEEIQEKARAAGIAQVIVLHADRAMTLGACMNLGVDAVDGDYIAKMDDDNYYGPEYLTDLVQALDYSDASVAGKWAHYTYLESQNATVLRFGQWEHRYAAKVQGGTMLIRADVARRLRFLDVPRAVDTTFLQRCADEGLRVYSADRFNFVSMRRADPHSHTWQISENELLSRSSMVEFFGRPEAHVTV